MTTPDRPPEEAPATRSEGSFEEGGAWEQDPYEVPPDGDHLVAIVFDKVGRAQEVLVNVMNLVSEGALHLSDAVVVVKGVDSRARIQQTVEITPGRGALIGGWLGILAGLFVGPLAIAGGAAAGALYGKLVDRGLDDGWIKEMATWLQPGSSMLLLLGQVKDKEEVLRELRRYEGQLVTTDLPPALREEIEEALRDHVSKSGSTASTPPGT